MSKKSNAAYERMFGSENHYSQIPITYPVIVKHKNGAVERFHENGVTEYLGNNSTGSTALSRTKQTKPKDEYEFWIRRLMYVSWGVGSEDDWNAKIKEADEMHDRILQCSLDEYYNGAKLIQDEQSGQVQQVEDQNNTTRAVEGEVSGIGQYSGEDPF